MQNQHSFLPARSTETAVIDFLKQSKMFQNNLAQM